jgi:citrate synthase
MAGELSSEEAARRLGVKLSTIYAYVSRGLVVPHRSADGRRSLFDRDDIEALARRSRSGRQTEGRLATVTTAITEIRPEKGPLYRGRPAVELALDCSFETVAGLLWQTEHERWEPAPVGAVPVTVADDRLRWATVMSGAVDPLRSDLRPIAVTRAGRAIVSTMTAALGGPAAREVDVPIARRLAGSLVGHPGDDLVDAVRAALVLLADHELASSTLAVRIAASTRADIYDAVLSGLGTVNGPLHGGASRQAHLLLAEAEERGSAAALDAALRWHRVAPGFGHFLYEEGDPRFSSLMDFVGRLGPECRLDVASSVIALARERRLPGPNVDLGLAALSFVSGMDPDAGGVIFKVARVAGWVAHYLEELTETPLRYRARAIYARST